MASVGRLVFVCLLFALWSRGLLGGLAVDTLSDQAMWDQNSIIIRGLYSFNWSQELSGLKNANAKRCVFWTQRTWTQALAPREVCKSQKLIAMRFLNASVLERKALNRNLSWGFPFGNLLPETPQFPADTLPAPSLPPPLVGEPPPPLPGIFN